MSDLAATGTVSAESRWNRSTLEILVVAPAKPAPAEAVSKGPGVAGAPPFAARFPLQDSCLRRNGVPGCSPLRKQGPRVGGAPQHSAVLLAINDLGLAGMHGSREGGVQDDAAGELAPSVGRLSAREAMS